MTVTKVLNLMRGLLHGYSLSHPLGRMRLAMLATVASIGALAAYSVEGQQAPALEGAGAGGGRDVVGGTNGADGGGGVNGAQGGVNGLGGQVGPNQASSPGDGPTDPSDGLASATSGSSSASGSSSSSSSGSSTSSSSTSTSGSPGDGLLPEDLGSGLGTGGLVNEDQFLKDLQEAGSVVSSTASSATSGTPLP